MHAAGRSPFRTWHLIILLGAILRLLLPWIIPQTPFQGDGYEYYRYAANLVEHGVYSDDFSDPRPGAGRVPGVPFLVMPVLPWAALQQPWVALPVTTCSILSLFLVARILRRETGIPNAWKTPALLLYALLPVYDLYNGRFYPDVPAGTAVLLLVTWLQGAPEKARNGYLYPLVSGLLVALSAYFRPEMVLHVLVPVLWGIPAGNVSFRSMFRTLMLALAGLGIGLLPWTARNAIQFGRYIPLDQPYLMDGSAQADARSGDCAAGLYAWLNTWYTREDEIKTVAWDFMHADLDRLPVTAFRTGAEKQLVRSFQMDTIYRCSSDRMLAGIAAERRSQEPFTYWLYLPAIRSLRLLFRTEFPEGSPAMTLGLMFLVAFQWMVHGGLIAGGKRCFRHPLVLTGVFLLLYRLFLFSVVHHVEYRYMLSVFPVLFLAAVVSVSGASRS